MKWIDTNDLRTWAARRDCQENLPLLVRKLIRATSGSITNIKFPAGESVLLGGWDGILETATGNDKIPTGTSLWEFGTTVDIKGKADDDFNKRTANPIGFTPSRSTFVFVTPRLWSKSEEWITEKKALGIWGDIKVINAELLEEWLDETPTVAAWLARKHLGKYPSVGIQPTDEFWETWSGGRIPAKTILGGRETQVKKLFDSILSPGITEIKGTSRDESIAFVVSSFKNDFSQEEDFFARSLIVDTPEAFRELSVMNNPLILIPRFEDLGIINGALDKGHTVLVPLGADSSEYWTNQITLPPINRDLFVASLREIGISREKAEKFSKESARNPNILRRLFGLVNIPEWARPENVQDIIPALLVGRWDEKYPKDREMVARLAGMEYDKYVDILNKWRFASDSPFIKIGSAWRLASPLDAWINASKYLTGKNFDTLHKVFIEILKEINPSFEIEPERRYLSKALGKERQYSEWIREGVIQSMILISIYKEKLDAPNGGDGWVNEIIHELLNDSNPLLWKSIDSELPLIAEASPDIFLEICEKKLAESPSPISAMFEEEPSLFATRSYHTGLLWALEKLAWIPEYIARAALILAKLALIDPDGNLTNRPKNSFVEIFKPWHYQTLASLEERMQVLRLVAQKVPQIAWSLLMRLLPQQYGVGHPTSKPRWRMLTDDYDKSTYSYEEMWDTHTTVLTLLLECFDFTEEKLTALLESSVNLDYSDNEKLFEFIGKNVEKIEQKTFVAWHTLRKILSRHRSLSDADWALPETELVKYQELYERLMPTDEILQSLWLFDDNMPDFVDGIDRKNLSYDEQAKISKDRKIAWVQHIYEKYGFEKCMDLVKEIKLPTQYGDILAHVIHDEVEILSLINYLNMGEQGISFIQAFIYRKYFLNGYEWFITIYNKIKGLFNNESLAELLIPLPMTTRLWDFIDAQDKQIRDNYWTITNVWLPDSLSIDEKVRGVKYLLEYQRFQTAAQTCSWNKEKLPSDILIELFENLMSKKSIETFPLQSYWIEDIFEELDNRADFDKEILIKYEWFFLPFLNSYGIRRKSKLLHMELEKNPAFFHEVLTFAYKPDKQESVNEGLSEEMRNRAMLAYELLNSFKKIPGIDDNGNIDEKEFGAWIKELRRLSTESGHIRATDITMGQLLAEYPQKPGEAWPPKEICTIIDSTASETLSRNFKTATFNKYGSTTRGALDGGSIEKERSVRYEEYAKAIQNTFPVTADILRRLSKGYDADAKVMDEQAEKDILEY